MVDLIPKSREITPLISELYWDLPVSDLLLQYQLSCLGMLQEELAGDSLSIQMGFQCISVRWKSSPHPSLSALIKEGIASKPLPDRIWEIPVRYSPATGRDLESVAQLKGFSVQELVSLHSSTPYRIHFFGFMPGFMYLAGLPEGLYLPRKKVPDRQVPKGSVAIGGTQTGIYPSSSPGGWHLIGLSPVCFFNPNLSSPVFASPGELVEFVPISEAEFGLLCRHPKLPKAK